jgi:hypothetical protein
MGLFSKLFGGGATAAPSIETVVNKYGAVLGAGTSVIRHPRELPFSKEVIKDALLSAIGMTPPGDVRTQLRAGFVSLADFQDPNECAARGTTPPKAMLAEGEDLLAQLHSRFGPDER